MIVTLRAEVERRLLREAQEHLEPNETNWLNLLCVQLALVNGLSGNLEGGAIKVLHSKPGVAVLPDQPPAAPDHPPK
jgi:hypothetical protein